MTFMQNKKEPVHRWFYYKEGYSPDLVQDLIKKFNLNSPILDPFCGTGTTLLACKQKNIDSIGFDITPLAVFVAKVKLEDNYDLDELRNEIINYNPSIPLKKSLKFATIYKEFHSNI